MVNYILLFRAHDGDLSQNLTTTYVFCRMALSVTACPNLTRDNYCWLPKILSSSWITSPSK